jgi:glycine/D-amino acid oxidase-like deaminating enzyme
MATSSFRPDGSRIGVEAEKPSFSLDIATTGHDDLHSGGAPWPNRFPDLRQGSVDADQRCDVLVVGGGITGALLAHALVLRNLDVLLIDREPPGLGSTAASTAMLQWEIDSPLAELADLHGFEAAADTYRKSLCAVQGLKELVKSIALPCEFRQRNTLYLAAGEAGATELRNEHALRQRAGLPGEYLGHAGLLAHMGIDREAAILSPGSADVDPLCLAHGLLRRALSHGLRLRAGEALSYDGGARSVLVELAGGRCVEARHVVLATGYAMPDIIPAGNHSVVSSWAISTVPQVQGSLWKDECLIWEASESYHYLRTSRDGRIIIGGEDETVAAHAERDEAIPDKARLLQAALSDIWPRADTRIGTSWAGFFGQTADGLPLIGRVPGHPRILAAYGYGGNGITFSFMAAGLLASLISGAEQGWFSRFALDRATP